MNFRYAILLLLISQLAFATCIGYTDKFDARVLDGKMRPLAGADISVKYDRGASFGEKYYTTPAKKTDQNGIVHFDLFNQGTLTREIDCSIEITGSAGNANNKTKIIAPQHGSLIDIVLGDVYPVNFYVRDHLGAPLEGASVTLGGITKKTDPAGKTMYYFQTDNYTYLASYKDGKQNGV